MICPNHQSLSTILHLCNVPRSAGRGRTGRNRRRTTRHRCRHHRRRRRQLRWLGPARVAPVAGRSLLGACQYQGTQTFMRGLKCATSASVGLVLFLYGRFRRRKLAFFNPVYKQVNRKSKPVSKYSSHYQHASNFPFLSRISSKLQDGRRGKRHTFSCV